jgi:MFS transporter, MHS family, proline/betaine transporter
MNTSYVSQSALDPESSQAQKKFRRILVSSMLGNALEWYDFALYGYFAALIGRLFFPYVGSGASPSEASLQQLLLSFGVYMSGFVMRPLGAVVFGHIGDRYGRQKSFLWSIYLMAIPTAIIGCLPDYHQAGIWAPIALTFMRLFQGFSMGGEFTGSMIYITENSAPEKRGYYGSFASFSVLMGVIGGSLFAALISSGLSSAQLESFGWRIPFIISLVGGVIALYMRRNMDGHSEKKPVDKKERLPVMTLFQSYKKNIGIILLIDLTVAVGFFLSVTFVVNYLQQWGGLCEGDAFWINALGMLAFAIAIPPTGYLTDRIGRKPCMLVAAFLLCLCAYPIFQGLSSFHLPSIIGCHLLFCVLMGIYFAPVSVILVEMFPAKVRYSGISIAHNVSMAVFGGSAPWLATWVIKYSGDVLAPSYYLMVASLLSMVGLFLMKDRFKEKLDSL